MRVDLYSVLSKKGYKLPDYPTDIRNHISEFVAKFNVEYQELSDRQWMRLIIRLRNSNDKEVTHNREDQRMPEQQATEHNSKPEKELRTVAEIVQEIERKQYLINAGKDSIYYSVSEGDFEKAKKTADQVTKLQIELREYKSRLASI